MRMRPGLAAVERRDLVGLDRARGQHGVGAVDDGRLGLGPAVRHVGLDLFGHRLRLDPVERVEGADERQVQLVLDHVAREPRQPVVGVHRGVGQLAGGRRRGHAVEHAGRELVDHRGQRLLGQGVERSGGNMVHPQPRLDVDHGRQIGRPGPGEDVAGHVGAGQGRGQLADVDVHAAAVAGAGLGQGGRVEGQDGEPAHGGQSLPVAGNIAPAWPCGSRAQAVVTVLGRSAGSAPAAGSAAASAPGASAAGACSAAAPPRARAGTRGRSARGPASAPR